MSINVLGSILSSSDGGGGGGGKVPPKGFGEYSPPFFSIEVSFMLAMLSLCNLLRLPPHYFCLGTKLPRHEAGIVVRVTSF